MWLLALAGFATGALGSVHCVAMCGGMLGVLSGGVSPSLRKRPAARLLLIVALNAGRVLAYALAGALFGLFSAAVARKLEVASLGLRLMSGALLVGLGLHLCGCLPWFSVIDKAGGPLFRALQPVVRLVTPVRSIPHAVALGAVWGFAPCGMVYTALSVATASGSAASAALIMGAFGAGTLPALVFAGSVAGDLASRLRSRIVRVAAGGLILTLGVMTAAYAAASLLPAAAPAALANCHPAR